MEEFTPKKPFLLCIDSDGCVMDTMDIKHIQCFGPLMVEIWNLSQWKEEILTRWNDLNLYTLTRGINRFKGLAMALTEINEKYTPIEDLPSLIQWEGSTSAPSESALLEGIKANPTSTILPLALAWSQRVNQGIVALNPTSLVAFEGALEGLKAAHKVADVVIVSSANRAAVMEEWEGNGLLPHVDFIMAQDAGTKQSCIAQLLAKGYPKNHVLMVGDAKGDLDAATNNEVSFYPIRVREEQASWEEFVSSVLPTFLSGRYQGEEETGYLQGFLRHLGE